MTEGKLSREEIKNGLQNGMLICGDSKEVLKDFDDNCIDLIYADPPFNTKKDYNFIWKEFDKDKKLPGFNDMFEGGIKGYINCMTLILEECYRVLKVDGSMYLHCDYHASHYLKIAMDKIFGIENIKNDIIWQRANSKNNASKKYNNICDNILFYTKSEDYVFNQQFIINENAGTQPIVSKKSGRFYCDVGTARYFKDIDKTILLDNEHGWRWKQNKIDEFLDDGGQFEHNKYPRKVMPERKAINNIWLDLYMHPSSKERIGFETQKPEELLKRIIDTSSNAGNIILDPFCGAGTTAAVCNKYDRIPITMDICPLSILITKNRLSNPRIKTFGVSDEDINNYHDVNFTYEAEYITLMNIKDDFEKQKILCNLYGGVSNPKKAGDGGIDGWKTKKGLKIGIQVKVSEDVGSIPLRTFKTDLKDNGYDKGVIIAISFNSGIKTKNSNDEYKAINEDTKDYIPIELITIKDLLKNKGFDKLDNILNRKDLSKCGMKIFSDDELIEKSTRMESP